jgi:hypothetical protein
MVEPVEDRASNDSATFACRAGSNCGERLDVLLIAGALMAGLLISPDYVSR